MNLEKEPMDTYVSDREEFLKLHKTILQILEDFDERISQLECDMLSYRKIGPARGRSYDEEAEFQRQLNKILGSIGSNE